MLLAQLFYPKVARGNIFFDSLVQLLSAFLPTFNFILESGLFTYVTLNTIRATLIQTDFLVTFIAMIVFQIVNFSVIRPLMFTEH